LLNGLINAMLLCMICYIVGEGGGSGG